MESTVLALPAEVALAANRRPGKGSAEARRAGEAGTDPADLPWPEAGDWRDAHLALAFVPACEELEPVLALLAHLFPAACIAGCETVTQFHGGRLATRGAVHLFRFTHGGTAEALVLRAGDPSDAEATKEAALERLAARLAGGDPALLLADGWHCPAEDLLRRLSTALDGQGDANDPLRSAPKPPPLAGGLGSQPEPPRGAGARVFLDGEILEAGCLAVVFSGVEADIQVKRGWSAAGPVYEVTRAEGRVLHEIAGEPAANWFRRLFSIGSADPGGDGTSTTDAATDGASLLPEIAHRFPLIVTGPKRSREGVYRSMRSFDDPPGAVTFWGNLETGDRIRLGIGNEISLVHHAGELTPAADAAPPEAAILYSCVGRQDVLGDAAGAEVAAVHGALGEVPLSGFFSFGEIGPTIAAGPAFYNHTAILVLLSERPVP